MFSNKKMMQHIPNYNKRLSKLGYYFLDTWSKDLVFVIFQIKNLNGINLSAKNWIIQIMLIFMVVVFSHVYVIMHQDFGKKQKMQKNEYISFYRQLDMFSYMIVSHTCF